jgi:hypothetical protein
MSTAPLRLVVGPIALMTVLVGCSSQPTSSYPGQGRVWFCQGVDSAHPSGSLTTIDVVGDGVTVTTSKVQVPGVADVTILPGRFVVRVNGQPALTSEVADGGTTSSHSGSGCPTSP